MGFKASCTTQKEGDKWRKNTTMFSITKTNNVFKYPKENMDRQSEI